MCLEEIMYYLLYNVGVPLSIFVRVRVFLPPFARCISLSLHVLVGGADMSQVLCRVPATFHKVRKDATHDPNEDR